jgi:hypothetical protein
MCFRPYDHSANAGVITKFTASITEFNASLELFSPAVNRVAEAPLFPHYSESRYGVLLQVARSCRIRKCQTSTLDINQIFTVLRLLINIISINV